MIEAIRLMYEILMSLPNAFARACSHVACDMLTRGSLFRDVRKLKNTPVSGDTIARIKRG